MSGFFVQYGKLKEPQADCLPLLAISLSAAQGNLYFLLHVSITVFGKCCSWTVLLC